MSIYLQLADLKAYSPVTIDKGTDDTTLQQALDWAEGEFQRLTGTLFLTQQEVGETPARAWVDRMGMLTILARRRAPVTAVASVSIFVPGLYPWTGVTWDSDKIFLPINDAPPTPDAWKVQLYPNNITLDHLAPDNLWVRWTYTAGYSGTPAPLKMTLLRLAWWKVKLREAPLGRINSEMFGTREIIPSLPKDIALDIKLWSRKVV